MDKMMIGLPWWCSACALKVKKGTPSLGPIKITLQPLQTFSCFEFLSSQQWHHKIFYYWEKKWVEINPALLEQMCCNFFPLFLGKRQSHQCTREERREWVHPFHHVPDICFLFGKMKVCSRAYSLPVKAPKLYFLKKILEKTGSKSVFSNSTNCDVWTSTPRRVKSCQIWKTLI